MVSAGDNSTETDAVDGLIWAFDYSASVANISDVYWQNDNNLHWIDMAFDYWARTYFRLITAAANNSGGYVSSPGKAWNVLTVGAYNDNNDMNWNGDDIASFSSYVDPYSINNDREKPEVVASGVNITFYNYPLGSNGTSFAAPQVAGLSALLINRNSDLDLWAEAQRAIIMDSATHNVDGPVDIPTWGDWKDGAGGINAAVADAIAETRNTSGTTPCATSCWWTAVSTNTGFPVGTHMYRYFSVKQGDRVRIAIAWWSNSDCVQSGNCNDRLDTDLDLKIYDPNSLYVVASNSWDNNYELVDFVAQKTGTYKIDIYKVRADESINFVGIAFARLSTFDDVPYTYWAWSPIESLYDAGISSGCFTSPTLYCPESLVTRAQMAVFLLKGIHGSGYTPPAATGTMFYDVPVSYWAAAWIEQLAREGITGGCGGGYYCPENPVTRAQMAVFLLRAEHGTSYSPPPATGTMFYDVPISYWAAAWIEQLAREGITGGCGGGYYCPEDSVTRAQMATFLVNTFNLP